MRNLGLFFSLCCICLLFVPAISHAAEDLAPPNFSGGKGTAGDPYLVASLGDLAQLAINVFEERTNNGAEYRASHYRQTADIDLSRIKSWSPIGAATFSDTGKITADISFSGVYDGGGHKIIGLHYEHADFFAGLGHFGLFGTVHGNGKTGGIVKNLVLENTVLRYDTTANRSFCGGIVGRLIDGRIENCTVSGRFISAVSKTPGGQGVASCGSIAGWMQRGRIENCTGRLDVYAQATTSFAYAGGIVGFAEAGEVKNSRSFGMVRANCWQNTVGNYASAGGIVGYTWNGKLTDCANHGPISADADAADATGGGITGGTSGGAFTRCLNEGAVDVSVETYNSFAGGLVGRIVDKATITHSLNRGEVRIRSGSRAGGIAGGLAGTMNGGSISASANTGSVSTTAGVGTGGGIVGLSNGGDLRDLANTGDVTAANEEEDLGQRLRAGGVIGGVTSDTWQGKEVRIERVYTAGTVKVRGFSDYVMKGAGEFIGFCADRHKVKIEHSYRVAGEKRLQTIGVAEGHIATTPDAGISAVPAAAFKDAKNLSGWDFKKTWHYPQSVSFPLPQDLPGMERK